MPTKTGIANAAMALIGQTRFTDVDTDTSEQAKWVRALWDGSLAEALRAHPWNFAAWRTSIGENLLLQSEAFSNASWTKTSVTATADQILSPRGTMTADLLSDADGGVAGTVVQSVAVPNNADTHTGSIYLKQGTAAVTNILMGYSGGTGVSTNADITWGATPTTSAGTLVEDNYGYWRLALALANNSLSNTSLDFTIYPAGTTAASTGTVYAWGAQITQTSAAVGYVPTTTAASRLIRPAYGYTYGLPLPTDYIRIYDCNDGDTDYKIEGSYMLKNDSTANIRYTRSMTDPAVYETLFARVLAIQLAKDICTAITGNDGLEARLDRMWNKAMSKAGSIDSMEDGADMPIPDPWITARHRM